VLPGDTFCVGACCTACRQSTCAIDPHARGRDCVRICSLTHAIVGKHERPAAANVQRLRRKHSARHQRWRHVCANVAQRAALLHGLRYSLLLSGKYMSQKAHAEQTFLALRDAEEDEVEELVAGWWPHGLRGPASFCCSSFAELSSSCLPLAVSCRTILQPGDSPRECAAPCLQGCPQRM